MTAQPKAAGYPGLRRLPRNVTGALDRRSSPLRKLALSPVSFPQNTPASETFLRGPAKEFGRKGLTEVEKRTALHLLSKGMLRMHPAVNAALTAYDIYRLYRASQEVQIPRDWQNAQDAELSLPPNWSSGSYPDNPPSAADPYWTPEKTWFGERSSGVASPDEVLDADVYPQTGLEFIRGRPWPEFNPGSIVSTSHPVGQTIKEGQEFDATPDYVGSGSKGYRVREWIGKDAAGPDPTFANPPRTIPGGDPTPIEVAVPRAPRFRDIPNKSPNPGLSPNEQTEIGPEPQSTLGENPEASHVPGPVTTGRQGPRRVVRPRPRRRPGKGTKEEKAKVKVAGVLQFVVGVAGEFCEFLDIVNAFWKAIPKELRPGYYVLHRKDGSTFVVRRWNASQAQRIGAVYTNFHKMDLTAVFQEILANQVEDMLYGKLGKKSQEAFKASGSTRGLGWQSGPWDTFYGRSPEQPKTVSDTFEDFVVDVIKGDNPFGPLPTVKDTRPEYLRTLGHVFFNR